MNNINLICLPYAGGCSNIYRNYFYDLGLNIAVYPIELPGRGKRFMEARLETFIDVITDVMDQIKPIIDTGQPYALFGYSMGSTIIFELYYKLMLFKYQPPKHMFFCASRPPVVRYQFESLTDEYLIEDLIDLGGTSKEVLDNKELLEICLPILRDDYKVMMSYQYKEHHSLIDNNITVMLGMKDEKCIECMDTWKGLSSKDCKMILYDGGHFFINEHSKEISRYIVNVLEK